MIAFVALACTMLSISSCTKAEQNQGAEKNEKTENSVSEFQTTNKKKNSEDFKDTVLYQNVYSLLSGDKYTFKVNYSSSSDSPPVIITRTCNGKNSAVVQKDSFGSYGLFFDGENSWLFDDKLEIYSETAQTPQQLDMISSIIDQQATVMYKSTVSQKYFECFQFTGATYITDIVFRYSNQSKKLLSYSTIYHVEGNDDYIENREVVGLTDEEDSELLISPVGRYKLFDSMSEQEKQQFIQQTAEKFDINSDVLKEDMTYSQLVEAVHKYCIENK